MDTMSRAAPRHFLDLDRIDAASLRGMLERGAAYKSGRDRSTPLAGKTLAMIFEKPSTRTRLSFEVGARQLGGAVTVLSPNDMQLARGETVADTARTLSRYVDAIMIRANEGAMVEELAAYASVPVINGLTNLSHPCQIMADVMTLEERKGPAAGTVVAWCGDGNNVATSWIHAAQRFGFALRLACPSALQPSREALAWARAAGARITLTDDPVAAASGADCIVTDVWVSMGAADSEERRRLLTPYQVTERLMERAKPDAIFLHCLPARRGQEVTAEVIDGPHSAVWDEAENRLHAQKGILAWCLG
jgi:ornithine carbamoyltransferase